MAWARLDDGFHDHPKVDGLSLAAVGLYTLCLTWAHRHRNSAPVAGFVPQSRVKHFASRNGKALTGELIRAGLWEVSTHEGFTDGWLIHDFDEYLPKQRDPEELREAGKKGMASRWKKATQPDSSLLPPSYPTDSKLLSEPIANDNSRASAPAFPSRPVPSKSKEVQKRAPTNAQDFVAEWLDHTPKRPPAAVVGQVAKVVAAMLAEGIDPGDVRRGLAAWASKGLHPSTLPSVVNEVMNAPSKAMPSGFGAASQKAAGWLALGTVPEGRP